MAWPYAFVDLNDAEKVQRRALLDWYGFFAQLSVIFPLGVLQIYFLAAWTSRRWSNRDWLETPSSPRVKEARVTGDGLDWVLWARRLRWWMGGHLVLGGDVIGSRGELLGAISWTVWLLSLCFAQTGRDYLHLTKRFGIVASSQLPFHYLLALRSPYSPIQYLTGRSHESLNILHQLLGRIITFLLYVHAALYMNFYVQKNLLASKIQEGYVICGMLGLIAFTALGTTALAPVRRASYRVFYITHVVLASALLPVLWFHVSHIRIYLSEATVVYVLNVSLRTLSSKTMPASLRTLGNRTLVEIRVPLSSGRLRLYEPGQHAYLSLLGHPASRTFRSNPFSLASVPSVDNELRFVARVLDGNTGKLAQAARTNTEQQLSIEGPYGLANHADELLQYERVLFIAGGIGGTFIAPLYRQLLADLSPSAGSHRRQKVSLVWIVRTVEDMLWTLPAEGKEREGFVERLQVCVTGLSRELGGNGTVDTSEGIGESIEMEERKGLLDGEDADGRLDAIQLRTQSGRPHLGRVIGETFSHGGSERCAVVVCGPPGLSKHIREEVGRWIWKGKDVWFWEESFAM